MELFCRLKDPTRRRVRYSTQGIPSSYIRNSTLGHAYTLKSSLNIALIFNYPISLHFFFFFLCLHDDCLVHFEFKTLLLLRSSYKNAYTWESGQIKSGWESLPRTTMAKLGSLLHADHWWQYWTHRDPKVQHAVELSSRAHTLHEQYPGVCAREPCKKGVQFCCRHCRYQLDCAKLACANTAEAAHQKSSPRLLVC